MFWVKGLWHYGIGAVISTRGNDIIAQRSTTYLPPSTTRFDIRISNILFQIQISNHPNFRNRPK